MQVELKAKRQPLSKGVAGPAPRGPAPRTRSSLDELALRKIVDAGRRLPARARRPHRPLGAVDGRRPAGGQPLATPGPRPGRGTHYKGKLLLTSARRAGDPRPGIALDAIERTTRRLDAWWSDVAPWPAPRRHRLRGATAHSGDHAGVTSVPNGGPRTRWPSFWGPRWRHQRPPRWSQNEVAVILGPRWRHQRPTVVLERGVPGDGWAAVRAGATSRSGRGRSG